MKDLGFTVVVPTHERPAELAACLQGMSRLRRPAPPFEVLVVDDGSGEPMEAACAVPKGLPVRWLRQENAGPASARNRGAQAARWSHVVFVDDDCVPSEDWLESVARLCARRPWAGVGGGTVNCLEGDCFAAAHDELLRFLYDEHNSDREAATFCASNNLAVPREPFLELGGFDPSFRFPAGEDRDFCERWVASGRELLYAPEIVVHHSHRMTLWEYWRQHRNYGRGVRRLHQVRRQRRSSAPRFHAPGFYARLLAAPFRRPSPRPLALGSLLALAQLATAWGYLTARRSRGVRLEAPASRAPARGGSRAESPSSGSLGCARPGAGAPPRA